MFIGVKHVHDSGEFEIFDEWVMFSESLIRTLNEEETAIR